MRIKFVIGLSSATGELRRSHFMRASYSWFKVPHQSAGYDKPSARLPNNSVISSREFDLGEPAR